MQTLSGVKLQTPRMSELLENDYIAELAKEDDTVYTRNWEKEEPSECPICNGCGHNIELGEVCVNCDGTGVEYKMVYGVDKGAAYAYTVEYGMNAKREYCKAMREAYAELQISGKHLNKSMMMPYALPKTIEMEMMARGYDVRNAQKNGESREIANIIAREYPDFMCVPYTNF